jgi:hypothetical protein
MKRFDAFDYPTIPDALSALASYAAPKIAVYLAGAILGCNKGEANDWRKYVADKLAPHNINGISPLRCEPLVGERYSLDYPDPRFGTPRAIAAKNRYDVLACPMTLAYLPTPPASRPQSYGTLGEIFWANAYGKQVILVSDDKLIMAHPVIDAAVNWKLGTLDEAIDVIVGVLGGYVGGKNV